jgi:hypothetical protein
MSNTFLKAFVATSLALILISGLLLDKGRGFVGTLLAAGYVLLAALLIRICVRLRLSDAATGVLVALSCAIAPILLDRLLQLFGTKW